MKQNDLKYFKELIEGKTDITWKLWWKSNGLRLKEELPRQQFLKLKFGRLERAAELLAESKIEFQWTKKADYHQSISNLVDDFCDDKGYPLLSKQRKLFGGAVGDYLDGNKESGRKKLTAHIQKIERVKDEVVQSEKLNDLEFDANSFIDQGQPEIGIEILKILIERFDGVNDLTQPAVNLAKETIANTVHKP